MELLRHNTDYETMAWRFDGLAEMIDATDRQTFRQRREGFVGRPIPTWDDMLSKLNKAWRHGQEVLEKMTRQLESASLPEVKSHVRRTRFNPDDGDEICLDRLRAGQDFWRKSQREQSSGPTTMTVIVDVGANANIDHDDILWRGAAAIALTEILESKGYQVELWLVDCWVMGFERKKRLINGCRLKGTGDALDRSTLTNAVSGWCYRSLMFAIGQSLQHTVGIYDDYGDGSARIPMSAELDYYSRDENRVFIAGAFCFYDAKKIVRDELEKLAK